MNKEAIYILALETSQEVCSIALFDGDQLVGYKETQGAKVHAAMITVLIEEVLKNSGIVFTQLKAVALSHGPGSYTGLRVGTSAAKGIAYTLKIPVITIDTLQIMVAGAMEVNEEIQGASILYPMVDARRMEVFMGGYHTNYEMAFSPQPVILDDRSLNQFQLNSQSWFIGNGAFKMKNFPQASNVNLLENILPSAKNMGKFAMEKYTRKDFADLAYFEPMYLKEFQGTIAKSKL